MIRRRERSQDVDRGVGNARRVMIGEKRRHVRKVAAQMDIVELNADDMFDAVVV